MPRSPRPRFAPLVRAVLPALAASAVVAGSPPRASAAEVSPPQGVVLLARRGWQVQEAELVQSLRIYTRDLNLRLEMDILPHEAASAEEQVRVADARCGRDVGMVLWFSGSAANASLTVLRCGSADTRALPAGNKKDRELVSHTLALKLRSMLTASRPDARTEPRNETRSEGKAETKAEARSEARADAPPRSELRPEARSEVRAEPRPEAWPEARADARPETRAEPPPARREAGGRREPASAPPPSSSEAEPPRTNEEPDRSGVAIEASTVARSPLESPPSPSSRPRLGAGPFAAVAWQGAGAEEGRLLGQGLVGVVGFPVSTRSHGRVSGGWTRFAARQTGPGTPPANDLVLSDFPLRLGWVFGAVQSRRWELGVGASLGLHLLRAEGTAPDRHGTVTTLSASVGPCVSLRGVLAWRLIWVADVHAETQLPRRRFALAGQPAADLGVLQIGVILGLGATFW